MFVVSCAKPECGPEWVPDVRERPVAVEPVEEPPVVKAPVEEPPAVKFPHENVYFEYDKSTLLSDVLEMLKDNAEWLKDNPDVSVIIEGHCDERGSNEYNIALGDRRAQSVKTFLVDSGIAVERLTPISYGEEKPLDPASGEEAWALNRRAHFVID
ncbi:MAG: peptidoglycan-associated lipoprotein Pal [Deltaproteobacteria bacterium]|nr:peptidoglycan-associated lipoprotein Pal [Deltaproteobacteria bacterium]